MQTLFQKDAAAPSTPLYVRCETASGPFSIELKLDLVSQIAAEISAAGSAAIEIGGILIGMLPTDGNPVLRINAVKMLARRAGDSGVFVPDPREHDQFVMARWESGNRGRVPVGFFRTHIRSGPMRPSLADRTLLAGEFDSAAYTLLLIDPVAPRKAAFFIGSRGELSEQPSVTPFEFEAAALGALPVRESDNTSRDNTSREITSADATSPDATSPDATSRDSTSRDATSRDSTSRDTASRSGPAATARTVFAETSAPEPEESTARQVTPARNSALPIAAVLLLLTVAAAAYAWSNVPGRRLLGFAAEADPQLSVSGGPVLRVKWNRNAASVKAAAAGKITIAEGENQRDALISAEELHAGEIEYQSTTKSVRVTLTLEIGSVNVAQTAVWRRQ